MLNLILLSFQLFHKEYIFTSISIHTCLMYHYFITLPQVDGVCSESRSLFLELCACFSLIFLKMEEKKRFSVRYSIILIKM